MNRPDLDRWIAGWRGPALAALVALLAGLPGLLLTPVLDREEARVAQATAQMLETGDLVDPRFQQERRFREPVGVNWAQAAAVMIVGGGPEARDIRPYRLPSLLGAMLAAAACAWGAAAVFGPGAKSVESDTVQLNSDFAPDKSESLIHGVGGIAKRSHLNPSGSRAGVFAGALLGATFLLSSEAGIAKTDALLCGLTTLAMAALGQIYVLQRAGSTASRPLKLTFWLALSGAVLVGGLTAPLVVGLTLAALGLADRRWGWMRRLGWGWGLPLAALILGPWAIAVTIDTDGGFWRGFLNENPLLAALDGRESWGVPGYYLLVAPLMLFPVTLMAPAALVTAVTRRDESGVRFAAAWLVPAWIVFELAPGQQWHQVLPVFGAIAWLAAAALTRPFGRAARLAGTVLGILGGLYVTVAILYALSEFGGEASQAWATPTIGLTLAAAAIGGFLLYHRLATFAVVASIGLGVLAHGALAGVARNLSPLWVSSRTAELLKETAIHPVAGRLPGPVAVTGYAQPSIVFLLGTETELTDGRGAALAVAQGRPAVVEARDEVAFRTALVDLGARSETVGEVVGLNYSNGDRVTLTLHRPERATGGTAR